MVRFRLSYFFSFLFLQDVQLSFKYSKVGYWKCYMTLFSMYPALSMLLLTLMLYEQVEHTWQDSCQWMLWGLGETLWMFLPVTTCWPLEQVDILDGPFLSVRCVCHLLELGLFLVLALIILTLPFSSISFRAALLLSTIQPSIFLFEQDVLMSLCLLNCTA